MHQYTEPDLKLLGETLERKRDCRPVRANLKTVDFVTEVDLLQMSIEYHEESSYATSHLIPQGFEGLYRTDSLVFSSMAKPGPQAVSRDELCQHECRLSSSTGLASERLD